MRPANGALQGIRTMKVYSDNPATEKALKKLIRTMQKHGAWFHEDITKLFDLLAAGHINPIIAAQIPLEKAAEAHRLLETGQVRGKVVLTCVHNC